MKRLSFLIISIILSHFGFAQKDTSIQSNELKTVKVSGKRKKPIELVNERYTTGLFSNMVTARTYDFINHPPTNNIGTILDYLQNILINVSIRRTIEGYELTTTRGTGSLQNYKKGLQKTSGFETSSILLYLDEQPVESNVFFAIHPYDVALVKYFPPGQSQISFNQGMGVLAIYTRKAGDLDPHKLRFKRGDLENMYESIVDTTGH